MKRTTAAPPVRGRGCFMLGVSDPHLPRPTNRGTVRKVTFAALSLVLAALILTPIHDLVPWVTYRYDQKRFVEVSLLALALAAIACSPFVSGQITNLYKEFPLPARRCFAIIVLIGLVSSSLAESPRHAYSELSLFMALFALALLLALAFRHWGEQGLLVCAWLLVAGTLVYLTQFLAGVAGALIQARPLDPAEVAPGYSNIRFLNQWLTWAIPLLAVPLMVNSPSNRIFRALTFITLAGAWFMLFGTRARGSMLGLTVAYATAWLLFHGPGRQTALLQIRALLAGLAAFIVLYKFLPYVLGIEQAFFPRLETAMTTSGRTELWNDAINLIASSPLLGIGPQHFAWYPNILAHPHNALLQIACEWGIPVAAISTGLAAWGAIRWSVRLAQTKTAHEIIVVRVALTASLAAAAVHSMLSGILVMPLSQLFLVLVVGAMVGLYGRLDGNGADVVGSAYVPTRVGALATMALLLGSLAPDALNRLEDQWQYQERSVVTVGPRMWQHGGIPH